MIAALHIPSPSDSQIAQDSQAVLAKHRTKNLELQVVGSSDKLTLSVAATNLLEQILQEMAGGRAVKLTSLEAELTSQQAADLLFVSRPYFIKLLERGTIPFRKVGKHRRIQLADVIHYKQQTDSLRLEVLRELSAQAQELGMGYEL